MQKKPTYRASELVMEGVGRNSRFCYKKWHGKKPRERGNDGSDGLQNQFSILF